MANPQSTNQNPQTNPGNQGNQANQGNQSNAGNQGQWGNQNLYGGGMYGDQGAGMYNPATWGIGNAAGGPYSGPTQGYGANWYGAPQLGGYGPLGYPMGGYGGGFGFGYGNRGFGGYGNLGYAMPQYGGLGGWGVPATATITEWWLIPGPASGMGPQNGQRSDQRIEEDVCDRLTAHGNLDARNIGVTVSNGEVTLTGTVESRQDKRAAENVADSVQGVKDVHNQLKVQPQQGQQGQQSQTPRTAKTH